MMTNNMMNYGRQNNINQTIQSIMQMKNQGYTPQAVMQMMMQSNPQYSQMISQMKNMANGKNPQEFITQLAKQNGVSEENINAIQQMLR